jgi:excisionase family DNA binding protein
VSLLAALSPDALEELRALVRDEIEATLAGHRDSMAAKRWLTPAETAVYLGCSARAVYGQIRRGRIPAAAVKHRGRSVLIDREALDRALERS